MLTVVEKVIFLQNVDVFSEVSTEQMAYLAAIVEEISYPEDTMIYKEQDHPDAIYPRHSPFDTPVNYPLLPAKLANTQIAMYPGRS